MSGPLLSTLKPNPKNPRTISDAKLKALKKSLETFGDLSGIVFNRATGRLAGGHQRIKVLPKDAQVTVTRKLDKPTSTGTIAEGYVRIGEDSYAYREVSWDETTEKAANIAANQHGGEWDIPQLSEWMSELSAAGFDLELTGFDDAEREAMTPTVVTEGLTDPDEVPELPAEPKTKPGDLYVLGRHRLLCGDSTKIQHVETLFGDQKAELCFTSPPYADQRDYNGGKELSTEHLATFIRASKHLVSYFAVNLGYSRKNGEVNPYWDDYIKEAKSCELKLLSWNVWHRGRQGSIGLMTAMFIIAHEWVFVFGARAKDLNPTVENRSAGQVRKVGDRQRDGTVKYREDAVAINDKGSLGTVLDLPAHLSRAEKLDHPAIFPVELPCSYIEAMTQKGDVVYEPFGGSGTTMIACESLGRRANLMEMDPRYCDVIVSRWERFTGQKAVLNPDKTPIGAK